jgi:hypothetical protein
MLFVLDKQTGEVTKQTGEVTQSGPGGAPGSKDKESLSHGAGQQESGAPSSKHPSQHDAEAPSSTSTQPPPESTQAPASSASNAAESSKSESSQRSGGPVAGGPPASTGEKRRTEEAKGQAGLVNGELPKGSAVKADHLNKGDASRQAGAAPATSKPGDPGASAKIESKAEASKPEDLREAPKREASPATSVKEDIAEKPAQKPAAVPPKQDNSQVASTAGKAEPAPVKKESESSAPASEPSAPAAEPTKEAPAAAAPKEVPGAQESSKMPAPVKQGGSEKDAQSASTPTSAPVVVAPSEQAAETAEAAVPTAASGSKEVEAEEPSFRPSQPAKQKKAEPPTGGEKKTYDAKFMLEFKELCKEMPDGVRQFLNSLNSQYPGAGGGAGGDGTPRGSSGGRSGAMAGQGMGMMPGQMGGSNGRSGTPVGNARMSGAPGMRVGPGQGGSQRDLRAGGGRGRNMPQVGNVGPVKPLERTENAYDVTKTKPRTHYDMVMKEVRGMLNKLTLTNFEKLSEDLVQLEIVDPEELKGIVSIIFDKSLEEAHFCNMYARLCNKIKDQLPKFPEPEDVDPPPGKEKAPRKELTFKRCLLNKCQEEFERADRYEDLQEANETEAQHAAKSRKVRMRMLGNIKFIGELFAQKILNEKIMHECVTRLLGSKDEDTIECLCKLMATIGKLLDHEKAKHYMDYYFEQVGFILCMISFLFFA